MRTFTFSSFSRLITAALCMLMALSLSGNEASATAPPAAPWGDSTTSINTDPKVGLVAVDDPQEGRFIAGCGTFGELYVTRTISERPYAHMQVTDMAPECRPGESSAPMHPRTREVNLDSTLGWQVLSGPRYDTPFGRTCAAPGVGVTVAMIEGVMDINVVMRVPDCGYGAAA